MNLSSLKTNAVQALMVVLAAFALGAVFSAHAAGQSVKSGASASSATKGRANPAPGGSVPTKERKAGDSRANVPGRR